MGYSAPSVGMSPKEYKAFLCQMVSCTIQSSIFDLRSSICDLVATAWSFIYDQDMKTKLFLPLVVSIAVAIAFWGMTRLNAQQAPVAPAVPAVPPVLPVPPAMPPIMPPPPLVPITPPGNQVTPPPTAPEVPQREGHGHAGHSEEASTPTPTISPR